MTPEQTDFVNRNFTTYIPNDVVLEKVLEDCECPKPTLKVLEPPRLDASMMALLNGWETPCPMRAMSRLPCPRSRLPCPRSQLPCTRSHLPRPSFYLPECTSHSDWLHHNNFIYIVILNYILSSEQQNSLANKGMHPDLEGVGPYIDVGRRSCRPPIPLPPFL